MAYSGQFFSENWSSRQRGWDCLRLFGLVSLSKMGIVWRAFTSSGRRITWGNPLMAGETGSQALSVCLHSGHVHSIAPRHESRYRPVAFYQCPQFPGGWFQAAKGCTWETGLDGEETTEIVAFLIPPPATLSCWNLDHYCCFCCHVALMSLSRN